MPGRWTAAVGAEHVARYGDELGALGAVGAGGSHLGKVGYSCIYTRSHVSKVLTTPWMSLLLCDWIWLCAGFLVNKAGPDSAMTVLS